MRTHSTAQPLQQNEARRRAPFCLTLMAPVTTNSTSGDEMEPWLDFDDGDVIARIVPVPPSISPALRHAIERLISLKFGAECNRLDRWLHADHAALRGASPFETLVAGDGVGVLRALLWSGKQTRGSRSHGASEERRRRILRLER